MSPRPIRRAARTYRCPRPSVPCEQIPVPPGAKIIPIRDRGWLSAFCGRCGRLAGLTFGGPQDGHDALCPACVDAERNGVASTTPTSATTRWTTTPTTTS